MERLEYDVDAVDKIQLREESLEVAIDAANESNRAGQDDHEQLKVAIKAYLWAQKERFGPSCPHGKSLEMCPHHPFP